MAGPRYPSAHAYLERLPDGIDSHPQCRAKASLIWAMLQSRPVDAPRGSLPDVALDVFASPPPVSSWVSEVCFNVLALAQYDAHFGGNDRDGFVRWVFDFNSELFAKPLYRILYAFISPRRLIKVAASRWGAFHRGTTVAIDELGENTASLRLEFPPHLFGAVMVHAFAAAWRSAARASGAVECHAEVARMTSVRADYEITWR